MITIFLLMLVSSASSSVLSTAVQSPGTHWKQTALWFNTANRSDGAVDSIEGTIRFVRSASNKRDYSIEVDWVEISSGGSGNSSSSADSKESERKRQVFALTASG
jgi:hypothetical protein